MVRIVSAALRSVRKPGKPCPQIRRSSRCRGANNSESGVLGGSAQAFARHQQATGAEALPHGGIDDVGQQRQGFGTADDENRIGHCRQCRVMATIQSRRLALIQRNRRCVGVAITQRTNQKIAPTNAGQSNDALASHIAEKFMLQQIFGGVAMARHDARLTTPPQGRRRCRALREHQTARSEIRTQSPAIPHRIGTGKHQRIGLFGASERIQQRCSRRQWTNTQHRQIDAMRALRTQRPCKRLRTACWPRQHDIDVFEGA